MFSKSLFPVFLRNVTTATSLGARNKEMDVDSALKVVGEFGRYQRKLFLIVSTAALPAFFQMLVLVFTAARPKWSCPQDDKQSFLRCTSGDSCCSRDGFICEGASFTSNFTSIAMEWDLLCGQSYKNELSQSIYMAGTMIGAPVIGTLADKHGRKKLWMLCFILSSVLAFASALSPSYFIFVALRFNVGIFAGGGGLLAFVLATESIGPSYRGFAGTMHQVFFALSIAILGILAYLIRDWRSLTIATCLPAVFGLLVFPVIPESPRWLASQGRTDEAEAILHKVAFENGLGDRRVTLRQRKLTSKAGSSSRTYGITDLFLNRNTCVTICVMILSWFVNSHVYYGLSLNVKNLGGNMYANFIFSGLVEIPSYILSVILLSWLGRRKCLFYFMMGAALSCWICMKLQQQEDVNAAWLSTMAMLGKFCISASFAVIYVYTSELFPTVIRNVAMGTTTVASRIGSISCPFVVLLGEQSKALPMLVFACLSLVAGMAGLKLPETKGQPMPETMEDLERPEVVEVKGTTQA